MVAPGVLPPATLARPCASKVLIVKTSSLGDVLHTLPAVTDAMLALPGIRFDWVVEEAFAEIPAWHSAVGRVIPVALRRWRKRPLQAVRSGEWSRFRNALRADQYDSIIDAQGLLKSAILTRMAHGTRCGLDRHSARESLAALAYQKHYAIPKGQQASERLRQLFAAVLDYELPTTAPDYGIRRASPSTGRLSDKVVFVHGTTWSSKLWPDEYWMQLAQLVNGAGLGVQLPWGNARELERAQQIAKVAQNTEILPKMSIGQIAQVLASARGVVGIDTGLTYLAIALGVPTAALYGATRPEFTEVPEQGQRYIRADFVCSPCMSRTCSYRGESAVQPACYQTLPPDTVWRVAKGLFDAH